MKHVSGIFPDSHSSAVINRLPCSGGLAPLYSMRPCSASGSGSDCGVLAWDAGGSYVSDPIAVSGTQKQE